MTVNVSVSETTITATLSGTTVSVSVASAPVTVSVSAFQVERFSYLVRSKAVDYTPDILADEVVIFTASATATLPTAVGNIGKSFNIKNESVGLVTVNTTSNQTIDGSLTQTLLQHENVTVMSDGANWIIL